MNLKALLTQLSQPAKLAILVVLVAKVLVLSLGCIVTYLNNGSAEPISALLNLFNRWDASNYVDIAKNGYVNTGNEANFIVFFPLYPVLIRIFTFDYIYGNLVALVISNVSSLVAFLYLYKLAKLEFNEGVAVKAVLFLSVFPTAYFLSAPYTEGLFFALVIASIYYARLGKWGFAGILGFLAALTRLAGLLLLPVLLFEYYHQTGWKPLKIRMNILFTFSALGGFLVYLAINQLVTGNPFTFMTVEATHWHNTFDPWTGLTRAYDWMVNGDLWYNITVGAAPLLFAVLAVLMIGVAVWKRLRPSLVIYMFLSWGLAVSTSWWVSVPRYVMAMFPMFILMGVLINKKTTIAAAVVLSAVTLCFFTVFFALGWWAF